MSITGIVENGSVKVPSGVPDGTKVEVVLPSDFKNEEGNAGGSFFDTVRELIGSVEGPADWAEEHDHYIHGTPKRSGT